MAPWRDSAPSSNDRTAFQPEHRGEQVFPNTAFFAQLIRHAHAGHVAIRDNNAGLKRTYSHLLDDALCLRRALTYGLSTDSLEDIERGNEVFIGVLAPGSYEYAVAVVGIYALGAAVVPLTVALPAEEASYFVTKSRQVAVVTSESAFQLGKDTIDLVNRRCGSDVRVFDVSQHMATHDVSPETYILSSDRQLDENGAGLVIFTSGTTGPPKGGVLRRSFYSEDTRATAEHYAITPQDVILHILPVHHATGAMINFLPFLMAGACIEFRSGSFDAQWTWDRWREGGLTVFSGVPTIYTRMMRHYEQYIAKLPTGERQSYAEAAARLRVMMCGTSALPRPVQQFWTTIRRGNPIATRYGSTEVGPILKMPLDPADAPDGSVGIPSPGADVKLSDGDEGELLVKTPFMISKYLYDDKATADAFDAEGYFKTGDIARRNGKYYSIIGRANQDIIKSGGYKISALDIERELLSLPYINEAMVVGVADDEFGQRVGAVVSLRADQNLYSTRSEPASPRMLTIDILRDDLRGRLASYKMPTLLRVFQGELPKTASGKVLKRLLGPKLLPSPGWENVSEVHAWHSSTGRPRL